MARQIYDPLFEYDFTSVGFRETAVPIGLMYEPKVNVSLTIADSLIRSVDLPLDSVDNAGQPSDVPVKLKADLMSAVRDMNITTGRYTLTAQPYVCAFYRKNNNQPSAGPAQPLSNDPYEKLIPQIRRISDSRTEVLINTTEPVHRSLDGILLKQIGSATGTLGTMRTYAKVHDYCIYAGGQMYTVINAARFSENDAYTAVLKLDKPLADDVLNGVDVEVVIPFGSAYQVDVDITSEQPELPGTIIRPPDFTVKTNEYQVKSTNYLNRNQLLTPDTALDSGSLQTVLDKALSGSGVSSAELGIDYRKYENFVFFGSAQERLENFKYKMEKLEHYSESMRVLSASNASESYYNLRNTNLYLSRSNKVISSFDDYEKFLYYNSSSNDTSSLGLYSASTWPKTNSTYPYTNQKVADTEAVEWFTSQSLRALDYDTNNLYNLEKIIPVHVRVDDQNANFLTFIHMIGQHFDTLWTYVQHINKLYDRDERFNIGISKDILYEALGSLGWTAQSGYSIDELWSYYNGTPFSGSSYDTLATPGQHPTEDITKEIWNRTLNNLPYLLKTRGTERGVKALLATYGMPSTLLQVSEYGGQSKQQTATTYYKKDVFNRSLQFNTSSLASIPFARLNNTYTRHNNTGLDTHEIRIKPTLYNADSCSVVMHAHNRWGITIEPHPNAMTANSSMSNHAELRFYIRTGSDHQGAASCSTGFLPLYDGDFWNVQISATNGANLSMTTDPQTFKLQCQKAGDFSNGKITHSGSGECTVNDNIQYWNGFASTAEPNEVLLGASQSGNNTVFRYARGIEQTQNADRCEGFSGSMQEYRAWHHSDVSSGATLEPEAFDNHTLNPRSIEGNSYTASYTDLLLHFPLGTDNVTYAISDELEVSSSHPRFEVDNPFNTSAAANDTLINFINFNNDVNLDWNVEEERHFIAMPDIVGNRAISDKVRIDSSPVYSGQLSRHSSSLSSSIELAGPDSPIVGVHFSPSHHIDLDMASQLGGTKTFDDFVGNPRDSYRTYYKELKTIRDHYWQKYPDRPTFQAYMNVLKYFDTSLFKQVDMMLPGRAIKQVGLEIRPTLLERNTIAQESASNFNDTIQGRVYDFGNDNQRSNKEISLLSNFSLASSSIALSEHAESSSFGTINPTVKVLQPFEDNYAYAAYPNRPSSFVVPFTGSTDNPSNFFQIGEQTSNEVPIYNKMRKSLRYKRVYVELDASGTPISRSFVEHEGQDFRATALERLYFDGCKIGATAGSIGGVIQYRGTDNSLTFPGIIPGILAAIEVVETNPNTVQVQTFKETVALPELKIR